MKGKKGKRCGAGNLLHGKRQRLVDKGLACWWNPHFSLEEAIEKAGI
jgi:hypothetical protein